MEFANTCPFCKETRFINNKIAGLPVENTILYESANLYIGVDISPLCRGHILIITKEHYFNFYELPNTIKKEVRDLQNCLRKIYKATYNQDVLFFEHGSNTSGTAGSSIDHAHLHCLPFKGDLTKTLNDLLGNPLPCNILESHTYKNEFPYIYIDNQDKNFLYKVTNLDSQFFRKVIANQLNKEEYLWQNLCLTNESKDDLEKTIQDLQNKIHI